MADKVLFIFAVIIACILTFLFFLLAPLSLVIVSLVISAVVLTILAVIRRRHGTD